MNSKLLLEISDTDFEPDYKMRDTNLFASREAARGIVMHGDKIALLHVTKLNYHKLPGGGVEVGENIEQAFKREIIEEVGCKCETEKSLGEIIEYRDRFKLTQISHIFTAHVVGEIGNPNFMEDETAEGFELMWVTLETAKRLISDDNPNDYEAKFIKMRDLYILKYYLQKDKYLSKT